MRIKTELTLFDITDEFDTEPHLVRVWETHVGKGVFAVQAYPATAIIGEITGEIVRNPTESSEYTFDFEDGKQLEPFEPFRFVNHSCDPNCEFDILEKPLANGDPGDRHLFLIALRDIQEKEQMTISYNWPAASAIECHCESENCVGWIVCESEIDQVMEYRDECDDYELEYEFHDISVYFPDD